MYTSSEQQSKRFGRNAIQIRADYGKFINDNQIQRDCPAVFAEMPHESRSDKFTFISTKEVLAALAKENFLPVQITQGGSKDRTKLGFTKHLIRLQRDTWMHDGLHQVGGAVPELMLLNAHDGTSSYLLGLGVLKIACLNGAVVDTNAGHWGMKIPHKGEVDDIIEAAYTVVNESEKVVPLIEDMTHRELNQGEQQAFANAAIELRFDEAEEVQPGSVLRPRRFEDRSSDLWTVFNRVQENLVRGGVTYIRKNAEGRSQLRHSRAVRGIDGDLKLNRALWRLATEMAKLTN